MEDEKKEDPANGRRASIGFEIDDKRLVSDRLKIKGLTYERMGYYY